MLSKNELLALRGINSGSNDVKTLSAFLDISKPQTYKIVRSLFDKEFIFLRLGTLLIEKKAHIAILLDILNDSPDSYIVLSDSGTEIIRTLVEPCTVSEISSKTGLHQTTITRKIDLMRRMGMVKKDDIVYSINEEMWPKLAEFAHSYDEYTKHVDPRVPFGSEIYYSSKELVVFSNKKELKKKRTAFSRYADFGMNIYPGTNYYCCIDRELDIRDIFLHSLYVVEKDNNWRSKMLALIFYAMHKDELIDIKHPIVDDMHMVLNGVSVEKWGTLGEMNERAKMYGVDLYDQ
ncbi:sugar-specific transcriptional regulator TrmB [Candidatus Methanoplasma termitum]|uniref:Sugar-specific transcriptional regulator TrmB n=1 Tax=Candidatus Methanoplasma termitum TaxID=1577791 RepID=A0A0A7LH98_9ARCH|nr:helix-turn-helix domain-containing protein [Candidatus Methanoplasma termitum]AIZ56896.1 sugar-specific transcriptional regulator TrmB [Candidatus Methanoplasma termitum]